MSKDISRRATSESDPEQLGAGSSTPLNKVSQERAKASTLIALKDVPVIPRDGASGKVEKSFPNSPSREVQEAERKGELGSVPDWSQAAPRGLEVQTDYATYVRVHGLPSLPKGKYNKARAWLFDHRKSWGWYTYPNGIVSPIFYPSEGHIAIHGCPIVKETSLNGNVFYRLEKPTASQLPDGVWQVASAIWVAMFEGLNLMRPLCELTVGQIIQRETDHTKGSGQKLSAKEQHQKRDAAKKAVRNASANPVSEHESWARTFVLNMRRRVTQDKSVQVKLQPADYALSRKMANAIASGCLARASFNNAKHLPDVSAVLDSVQQLGAKVAKQPRTAMTPIHDLPDTPQATAFYVKKRDIQQGEHLLSGKASPVDVYEGASRISELSSECSSDDWLCPLAYLASQPSVEKAAVTDGIRSLVLDMNQTQAAALSENLHRLASITATEWAREVERRAQAKPDVATTKSVQREADDVVIKEVETRLHSRWSRYLEGAEDVTLGAIVGIKGTSSFNNSAKTREGAVSLVARDLATNFPPISAEKVPTRILEIKNLLQSWYDVWEADEEDDISDVPPVLDAVTKQQGQASASPSQGDRTLTQ